MYRKTKNKDDLRVRERGGGIREEEHSKLAGSQRGKSNQNRRHPIQKGGGPESFHRSSYYLSWEKSLGKAWRLSSKKAYNKRKTKQRYYLFFWERGFLSEEGGKVREERVLSSLKRAHGRQRRKTFSQTKERF